LTDIKGNFLFVLAQASVRMGDKNSISPMIEEHAVLFGEGMLKSTSADKGYWSGKNYKELMNRGIEELGASAAWQNQKQPRGADIG